MTYTLLAIVAYGLIILSDALVGGVLTTVEAQNIATRLIMMAGVAFCAGLYRAIETDRRHGRGRMFQIFTATGSSEGESS